MTVIRWSPLSRVIQTSRFYGELVVFLVGWFIVFAAAVGLALLFMEKVLDRHPTWVPRHHAEATR